MEIFRKEYSPASDMSQDVKPPQNVLSAYAFFFKETQASIKSQQPDATFESVSRIVENMWQALEENQKEKYRSDLSLSASFATSRLVQSTMIVFRKMNEADKERFKREKELYDRGVAGGGVATVRVAAPAPVQEAGTVQVGAANIFYINI